MPPSIQRILHGAGAVGALAGIVFVGIRLWDYWAEIDFSSHGALLGAGVAAMALVYGLANTLLALGWWNLLQHHSETVSRRAALRIYGLSVLAKYVPGNVMHIASRQALGLAAGYRGWALVKASAWELGLICAAAVPFAVLVLPAFSTSVHSAVAAGLFLGIAVVMAAGFTRFVGRAIARAFCLQVGFLLVAGSVFVGLLALLSGISAAMALIGCGAFVIAWLAGLATPGAPAGIGVRELLIVFLLGGTVAEADLLMVLLLSRMVTVIGDCLFFSFFCYQLTDSRNS